MSQQVFADRIGKSKSWVDKVERGVRTLDRLSVVTEVADVLGVDAAALVGDHRLRPAAEHGLADVRDRVDRLRLTLAVYHHAMDDPAGPAPDVQVLQRQVDYVQAAYDHGRHPDVLGRLAQLVGPAQRAHTRDPADATGMLVDVYRLAAAALVKVDEAELAWLAADRAMATAVGHPALVAAAAVPLTQALRSLGRLIPAVQVAITGAHRVAPDLEDDVPPGDLALCGTLLVEAGLAAARAGDGVGAYELIDQAADVAGRVDRWGDPWRARLCPAAAVAARVAAAVALGDHQIALDGHARIAGAAGWQRMPAEYRAAHLVEVARAYLRAQDPDAAAELVVEAERVAPGEVRSRPAVLAVVAEVVRRQRRPAPRLADLVGVA